MWKIIPSSFTEVNLNVVLSGGQSFRWKEKAEGHWMSVLGNYIWSLKQDPKTGDILYMLHTLNKEPKQKRQKTDTDLETLSEEDCKKILSEYFQFNVNLESLYSKWCLSDDNFCKISTHFPGVRILRQDPVENLFSFICSSNNNITRISSMVEKLCENWGKCVGEVNGKQFYSFPTVDALCDPKVEAKLRGLGFGYRAKYISQTANILRNERKPDWLTSLRYVPYEDAHKELVQLPGIGPKVADCICLMSLDKGNAIPVDTHVWQIAARDYLPHLKKKKTVTAKSYKEIGDFFRERFGDYAGWAHSVLFCSDLKKFMAKENKQ